jgi:hypothetical protein
MLIEATQLLSDFLSCLAEELDIPPSKYKQAVERYEAVGNWLDREGSALKAYRPEVYPQGSFRLGTVIRPLEGGKESDYDIDLVCQVSRDKLYGKESHVKHSVGDRLKENKTYKRMLSGEEGRRCWTLNYAEEDGIGFHMDCLPSVPEDYGTINGIVSLGVPLRYAQDAIAITHTEQFIKYEWLSSNPQGYAEWFDDINQAVFVQIAQEHKRSIFRKAQNIYANVDQVPNGLVRTPLQRAIQLLKRHRDRRFIGHLWEKQKPISMIITTLAAQSYNNEADIFNTLMNMVENISNYSSSNIIQNINGQWRIQNPVNPNENFADRWNEIGSKSADAFFLWIDWLQEDLKNASNVDSISGIVSSLSNGFDESILDKTSKRLDSNQLIKVVGDGVPSLADTSHQEPPLWPVHLNYKATINATVHKQIREAKKLWQVTNRAQPKNVGLRFKAETNVPRPYEIKWQVVNTGTEAALANGLRGSFDDGEGLYGASRWEYTSYRGTHWIEAFVIKDGICMARSGRMYVRIK